MPETTSSSETVKAVGGSQTMAINARREAESRPKQTHDHDSNRGSTVRHDMAITIKRLLPYLLIGLIVFAVLIPVSTIAIYDQSIFNLTFTHDQLKFRFYLEDLQYPLLAATILFGAIVAFGQYRFVTSRSESTAYFSLSLSRGRLFGVRTLCGFLTIVLAIVVPMLISLMLNVMALGAYTGIYEQWAYVTVGLVLTATVSMLLTTISLSLSGTIAESILCYVALISCVSVVSFGLDQLASTLLLGNPYGSTLLGSSKPVASSLFAMASAMNPITFFSDASAAHQTFSIMHPVYAPAACDWSLVVGWVAIGIILCVLAARAFIRRKAEIAGIANTNRAVTVFVAVVFSFAAFACLVAAISTLDATVSMVCGLVVFALVSLLLLRGPLRGGTVPMRRSLVTTVVSTVCVGLVIAIFAAGGFGFSSKVPEAAKVSSVTVTYAGTPDYLGASMDTAQAGSGTYYFSAKYTYTDADAIQTAVDAQSALVDAGKLALDVTQNDFSETAVPYDLVFEYTMTDGSTLLRYYDRATYGIVAQLLGLDGSTQTAQVETAVISGDMGTLGDDARSAVTSSLAYQAFQMGSVYLCDPFYAQPHALTVSASERAGLLRALAKDVASQSIEDRYHPQSACRGILMFTQSGQSDVESFAYRLENSVIYLTDEYTNTLAWLDANGLTSYLAADSSVIESLTFQRYDPHASSNALSNPQSIVFKGYRDTSSSSFVLTQEWGVLYSTTDATEIAQIVPHLKNTYAVDKGGYLVCAKLSGINAYSYFYLPADETTAELRKSIG